MILLNMKVSEAVRVQVRREFLRHELGKQKESMRKREGQRQKGSKSQGRKLGECACYLSKS